MPFYWGEANFQKSCIIVYCHSMSNDISASGQVSSVWNIGDFIALSFPFMDAQAMQCPILVALQEGSKEDT